MLYREPKLLKLVTATALIRDFLVSVLYREPKLLKSEEIEEEIEELEGFSALP